MSEVQHKKSRRFHLFSHRGRTTQVPIYLGKQFRFFINQSDWKVIPMAGIIALLVSMVIRRNFFVTMEGNLMGSFALTCVAIWNGAFNSIQAVCRERPILKREHRSGLHISSYMCAHMIYQLFLCLAQTVLTLFVLLQTGVRFPARGFMTPWIVLDMGITMLLISYASDMMSLLISSISHTTTGAMTVMPFVLIFQLVFCGGIIPLPEWARPVSNLTISNYGIRAIAAQSGYNETPSVTVWDMVSKMKDTELGGEFTVGQVLELLDSPYAEKHSDMELLPTMTVKDALYLLFPDRDFSGDVDEEVLGREVTGHVTLGGVNDALKSSEVIQGKRNETFTLHFTVGDLLDIFGEENVKTMVQEMTMNATSKPEFESTEENVTRNWLMLALFAAVFAMLATLALELIDRDKR